MGRLFEVSHITFPSQWFVSEVRHYLNLEVRWKLYPAPSAMSVLCVTSGVFLLHAAVDL